MPSPKVSSPPLYFSFNELFNEKEEVVTFTNNLITAENNLCHTDKELFERELINLLKSRKVLLIKEIKENTDNALLTPRLPETLLSKLTKEEKSEFIEKRGEFIGITKTLHVDYFENPKNTKFLFYIIISNNEYEMFSSTNLPIITSNIPIKVKGITIGKVMALDSSEGMPIQVVKKQSPFTPLNTIDKTKMKKDAKTLKNKPEQYYITKLTNQETTDQNLGEQNTLVITINLGERPAPISKEKAQHLIFEEQENTVQDYYKKNSYNKVSFKGDVFGPYTLLEICKYTFEDLHEIQRGALLAAQKDMQPLGKKLSDYKRLIIFVPHCAPSFTRSIGAGTIGGAPIILPDGNSPIMSTSWNFVPGLQVATHELGHNFGVHHANAYYCEKTYYETLFSYECNSEEYDDPFSAMGNIQTGHHNAPHKKEIGWLSNDNIITTTEGTYTLKPLEIPQAPGTIQMIRIPLETEIGFYGGDDNLYYTLELRQPIDYDEGFDKKIYKGVGIRIAQLKDDKTFVSKQTNLIKKNDQYNNLWLLKGESLIDKVNGYKITLNDISGKDTQASAQISIEKTSTIKINFEQPIVHYTFDEKIQKEFYLKDNAGYVNGGKVKPAILTSPENKAGGILFHEDGGWERPLHEYIELNGFPSSMINKNNQFTISTWVNILSLPKEKAVIHSMGLRNSELSMDKNRYLTLSTLFSNEELDRTHYVRLISDQPLELRKWYHIVTSFNGKELKLIINGIEKKIDSTILDKKEIRLTKLNMKNILRNYVGGLTNGYGLNGVIDEFKIYARALSTEEISNLYTTFNPPNFCTDSDGDSYGIKNIDLCNNPQEDCKDTDPNTYPRAKEVCGDGFDNQCPGDQGYNEIDENCPLLIYNIKLSAVHTTENFAVGTRIQWETTDLSNSKIDFGYSPEKLNKNITNERQSRKHTLDIFETGLNGKKSLQEKVTYYYKRSLNNSLFHSHLIYLQTY